MMFLISNRHVGIDKSCLATEAKSHPNFRNGSAKPTSNNFAEHAVLVVQMPRRLIQDEELRAIGGWS